MASIKFLFKKLQKKKEKTKAVFRSAREPLLALKKESGNCKVAV